MHVRIRHIVVAVVAGAALVACGPGDTDNDAKDSTQSPAAKRTSAGSANPGATTTPSNGTDDPCGKFKDIDIEWMLPGAQSTWRCRPNEMTDVLAEQVWSDGQTRIAVSVISNSGKNSYEQLVKLNPSNCHISVLNRNRDCQDKLDTDGVIWINMGDSYAMIMQSRDSRDDVSPLPADVARAAKMREFAAYKVLPVLYQR